MVFMYSFLFSLHPYPTLRHNNSLPLYIPPTHTVSPFLLVLFIPGTLYPLKISVFPILLLNHCL